MMWEEYSLRAAVSEICGPSSRRRL